MTMELLFTIVAASLLGSTHCAGMCGPFVLLMVGKPGATSLSTTIKLAAYHLGRLTTYLLFGLLAGTFGQALNKSGYLLGSQQAAACLAAFTMFISATILLLRQLGVPLQHLPIPAKWVKTIYAGFKVAKAWPEHVRAWWIGLLTTWIPCGWLYAFVIVAAGSGSALMGSIIMFAFWLGTIPLLSVIGVSAGQLSTRWRKASPWIAITACLVLGWMTLFHRSSLSIESLQSALSSITLKPETVPQLNTTKLPCCHDD